MNKTTTSVSFAGLTLRNPIMPASGPLVGDGKKMIYMLEQGVGAIVTKTISKEAANVPRPCIYGGKNYVMNSELWSEHPIERWVNEFLPQFVEAKIRKGYDTPLIVSVGYSKEDLLYVVPQLEPWADAFEVSTHYVGKDLGVIDDLVRGIRSQTQKPIFMKISPHMPDPIAFTETILKAGGTGIAAINSLGPTMKIDLDNRRICYGNEQGYVWTSGPVIKPVALAMVYQLRQHFPDMPIIGVGGIETTRDIMEFMLAGANAIALLSAALIKGKELYHNLVEELPTAMKQAGFESCEALSEVILKKSVTYSGMPIIINEERCSHCRLCERLCPYFAISYEERILIDADVCFSCGLCVSKCPTHALMFQRGGV